MGKDYKTAPGEAPEKVHSEANQYITALFKRADELRADGLSRWVARTTAQQEARIARWPEHIYFDESEGGSRLEKEACDSWVSLQSYVRGVLVKGCFTQLFNEYFYRGGLKLKGSCQRLHRARKL